MLEDHTAGLEDDGAKVFKSYSVGFGDGSKESKKRKRNLSPMDNDGCLIMRLEKFYKRVTLSLAKPSFLLGRGSKNVRPENRGRLYCLLQKLVRQHNWTEACGVLSMLLKGTSKDNCPTMNRFKYLVSMELLKHVESDDDVNLGAINGVYDTWMTRIGINLTNKRNRRIHMKEDVFIVRLESILIQFMQGDIKDERQNARSLMQEHEFEGHPMFHMIIGLILYQLWYSHIPESIQWKDSDQIYTPTCSDMSANPSHMSAMRFRCKVGSSGGHASLSCDESESSLQCNSETSVMNDKKMPVQDGQKEVVPMEVDINLQRNSTQDIRPHGFYVNYDENEASIDKNGGHMDFVPNLFALKRLDSWLLPLQTKNWELERLTQDDEYDNAIKYLREAVSATPPVMAALLPLMQLLLIRSKDQEALCELEKFCGNPNAALPIRLRAHLLECIDPNNSVVLSTCFEDILKNDPTCSKSLARLINLHQNGNYSPVSLLEMFALHLDAVFAEYNTWREFALCFLKVSQYEEDRLSVCLNGNEGGEKLCHSVCYNRIPNFLIHGESGKAWRIRCRWWLVRHFSKSQLLSEIAAGDMQQLTFKAACASHLYGPDFDYVTKAYICLENEHSRDLLMFLQLHRQNSIGLQWHLQQRTN